jgi:hypothetical protein
MNRRIVRIAPWQAGKVAAVLYFILGIVIAGFMALAIIFAPLNPAPDQGPPPGWGLVIVAPFLYALIGIVFVPAACWLYNLVAGWVGGIEVTVEERPEG